MKRSSSGRMSRDARVDRRGFDGDQELFRSTVGGGEGRSWRFGEGSFGPGREGRWMVEGRARRGPSGRSGLVGGRPAKDRNEESRDLDSKLTIVGRRSGRSSGRRELRLSGGRDGVGVANDHSRPQILLGCTSHVKPYATWPWLDA